MKQPVVLMVLDGWGLRNGGTGNAIFAAEPVNFNKLAADYPYTELEASGLEVGLPDGQMGNSEVGHLNLGAGRVVYQEMTRISKAIKEGDFFKSPAFVEAISKAAAGGKSVHLAGLLSDGGVHSLLEHLFALVQLSKDLGAPRVFIHAFTDGRDVPPSSGIDYVHMVERELQKIGIGKIATIGGRYWGMDRDRNWERVAKAYQAIVQGVGKKSTEAASAVQESYADKVTDEFIEPVVIVDEKGEPLGRVTDGDTVIFFNYRADRARQFTRALVDHNFDGFDRRVWPQVHYVCMTQYDAAIKAPVAFMPQVLDDTLGEFFADRGLKQLRIAETEKYAHVTFFFNGGVEEPNPGEDRILIPSPSVATYDLQPEMSAPEVTRRLLNELEKDYYDVVILNYANTDMVGHTGVMDAAVQAVKTVDNCLQQVVDTVLKHQGSVIITADHGNAEVMGSKEEPHTAHTLDKVPIILISERYQGRKLRSGGSLQDVAPTMLEVMGIDPPGAMTGHSLIEPQ